MCARLRELQSNYKPYKFKSPYRDTGAIGSNLHKEEAASARIRASFVTRCQRVELSNRFLLCIDLRLTFSTAILPSLLAFPWLPSHCLQIGRASCRERV